MGQTGLSPWDSSRVPPPPRKKALNKLRSSVKDQFFITKRSERLHNDKFQ